MAVDLPLLVGRNDGHFVGTVFEISMLLTPASNYWQYPRRHDLSNPCLLECSAVQCLQYSTIQNSTVQLCHGSSTIKIMPIVPNHQELELNIAKNRDIENYQSVSNVTSSIMMDIQSSLCAFEHRVIPIESDHIVPDRATSLLCSSRVGRRRTTKKAATATVYVKQPCQLLVGKFQW